MVAWLVVCLLRLQADIRETLSFGTFFRRVSCQLFVKVQVNTGKLPLGGLPRNSVAKLLTILTLPIYSYLFWTSPNKSNKTNI